MSLVNNPAWPQPPQYRPHFCKLSNSDRAAGLSKLFANMHKSSLISPETPFLISSNGTEVISAVSFGPNGPMPNNFHPPVCNAYASHNPTSFSSVSVSSQNMTASPRCPFFSLSASFPTMTREGLGLNRSASSRFALRSSSARSESTALVEFMSATSLSVRAVSISSYAKPTTMSVQKSRFDFLNLCSVFVQAKMISPVTPTKTPEAPGWSLTNSQAIRNADEIKHIDEQVDKAAPFVLLGSLLALSLSELLLCFFPRKKK